MRRLRRPLVHPQVVPAGSLESSVAEDLLDVAHRTAVEEQLGRGGVSQDVWGDPLG